LPRLFFGYYLTAQFYLLQQIASDLSIKTIVRYSSNVINIQYDAESTVVLVYTATEYFEFQDAAICRRHTWPSRFERKYKGYFDSPYPRPLN